ncbi:hypothetical protein [Algoriphagus formosus]|uniref:hypothetical protein n=1 Tax=Algoriphagus formosus TaxID=2007308 RepID=UPI003F70E9E1
MLKARLVTAQYKRRGTMSEMLGKKDTTPSQRWALIFGLKTFIGSQQDGDGYKKSSQETALIPVQNKH